MMIDIKEIQNILYVCNVNFYELYVDTEGECIVIELDELAENVDDSLMGKLGELFDEMEYDDELITLYFDL